MQIKDHPDSRAGILGWIRSLIQQGQLPIPETLSWFVIILGVVLRLRQYIANRSLWVDEASLALNIVHRSLGGLTQALDYNQGAPIGFLFIEKLAILIFENNEYSLRLFPLVSGLLSVCLIYLITKEQIGRGMFAVIMLAVSPTLIYYSSELKQYSSDVMISLLLLYFSILCFRDNENIRSYILLCLAGAGAIWISHPSIFVLAGIGLVLAGDKLINRNLPQLLWVLGMGIAWVLAFGLSYYLSLRSLAQNQYLNEYWINHFPPLPPWDHLEWYGDAFTSLLENISPSFAISLLSVLCSILILIGIIACFRRNLKLALITILPFVMAIIASGLHLYPLSGRFLLFLVPFAVLLLAEGLSWLYSIVASQNRNVAMILYGAAFVALTWSSISISFQNLINPTMGEHIKPVLEYVHLNMREDDTIYVFSGSVTPFRYYANSYHLDTANTIVAENSSGVKRFIRDVENLQGKSRIWFIFSHVIGCGDCEGDKVQFFAQTLDGYGKREDEFHAPGADVFLYDLTQ